MATKKEKEAFKQAALKMSRYRLRRALAEAGLDPKEIREAEVEGEDEMVSVLVTKFDDGDIDMVGLEKAAGKSLSDDDGKKSSRKAKKKDDDDEDDPYSSAFGDDDDEGGDDENSDDGSDDENDGDDENSDDDDGGEDGFENDETEDKPPPRKAKKKSKGGGEKDGAEVMLGELMELQTMLAEVTDGLNDEVKAIREQVNFLTNESLLFHEIVKFAFARIWKLGAAKPLKPGFGDVIKKGKELLKKRFSQDED